MLRLKLSAVALCCAFSMGAMAGAARAADATQPAKSVAEMKARLATLKEESAALEAKIAAAEAPAAGVEPALVTDLNSMPKNLWPGDNDSPVKISLRDKWLDANIKIGASYTFTGVAIVVTPYTINMAGKKPVDAISITLDCGKHTIWGKEKGLRIVTVVENVTPADTLDWDDKKTITITGPNESVRPDVNPIDVRLGNSQRK